MNPQELRQTLLRINTRVSLGLITPEQGYAEFQKQYVSVMRGSVSSLVARLVKSLVYVWLRDSERVENDGYERALEEALIIVDGCLSEDEIHYEAKERPEIERIADLVAKSALKTLEL